MNKKLNNEIIELDNNWKVLEKEKAGMEGKFWIMSPKGEIFLFKPSKNAQGSNYFPDVAEVAACNISKLLQIPHAEYFYCSIYGERHYISKDMRKMDKNKYIEEIVTGDMISSRNNIKRIEDALAKNEDINNVILSGGVHTVANALNNIKEYTGSEKFETFRKNHINQVLKAMLVFNQDFARTNWCEKQSLITGEVYPGEGFDFAYAFAFKQPVEDLSKLFNENNEVDNIKLHKYLDSLIMTKIQSDDEKDVSMFGVMNSLAKNYPQETSEFLDNAKKNLTSENIDACFYGSEGYIDETHLKVAKSIINHNLDYMQTCLQNHHSETTQG